MEESLKGDSMMFGETFKSKTSWILQVLGTTKPNPRRISTLYIRITGILTKHK